MKDPSKVTPIGMNIVRGKSCLFLCHHHFLVPSLLFNVSCLVYSKSLCRRRRRYFSIFNVVPCVSSLDILLLSLCVSVHCRQISMQSRFLLCLLWHNLCSSRFQSRDDVCDGIEFPVFFMFVMLCEGHLSWERSLQNTSIFDYLWFHALCPLCILFSLSSLPSLYMSFMFSLLCLCLVLLTRDVMDIIMSCLSNLIYPLCVETPFVSSFPVSSNVCPLNTLKCSILYVITFLLPWLYHHHVLFYTSF